MKARIVKVSAARDALAKDKRKSPHRQGGRAIPCYAMNLLYIQKSPNTLALLPLKLPANLAQRLALALQLADLRDSLDHTGMIQLVTCIRGIGDL